MGAGSIPCQVFQGHIKGQGHSRLQPSPSDSIKRSILAAQIAKQRLMIQWPAGDALAQNPRTVASPGMMDVFVEPTLEAAKLAAAEVGIEIAQVVPGLLHELG